MSLPTPYYQDSAVTLYHADCREVLPLLKADAVVTDPPYGIGLNTYRASRWWTLPDQAPIVGDCEPFDPAFLLSMNLPTIAWGANHYASRLPDTSGWLCWDKATRDGFNLQQAEIEFAWTNCVLRPRMLRHMWSGAFRDSERGTRFHPTQKPADLMGWCISLLPDKCDTILDPFAGSGTTLVAAKRLGRKAIGIEIEERYCEIAVRRLAQEQLL